MKKNCIKPFYARSFAAWALVLLFLITIPLYSQNITGGHRSGITALIHKGDEVISAGEDGFIVIWNIDRRAAIERFQLTTYRIDALVSHPLKDEICIVETGGIRNYRISAWNYKKREKLFTIHSDTPVTYINYSGSGNFLITAGFNGSPLVLLDSVTGEVLQEPEIPEGVLAFAATGTAERNMLLYQSEQKDEHFFEGQILYLDIETGSVTNRLQAPGYLNNIITFGNNRFLAGVNSAGLHLVDAVTGEVFDINENIERNALLYPSEYEFYCLSQRGGRAVLYDFSVSRNGQLVISKETPLPLASGGPVEGPVGLFAFNNSCVFASARGNLLLLDRQNSIIQLEHGSQTRITEISSGKTNVAFLTENNDLFFIPLDYRLLKNDDTLSFANKQGYSRITFSPESHGDPGKDNFILWQSLNTRLAPQLVNRSGQADSLNFMINRFPLRSVSALNNNILVLDSSGNLSVWSYNDLSAGTVFTFSSAGSINASFISNELLILCRSVINNNSPFLSVNFRTGETVPIPYSAQAGLLVNAGKSGSIYAVTAELTRDGMKTSVVDISAAAAPEKIYEYRGEAVYFSLAESNNLLAVACESEGAVLFNGGKTYFERTNGLPVKLLGCDDFFISLDSEGNIVWYDNKNAKILAVFSIYEDRWKLKNGEEISGKLSN